MKQIGNFDDSHDDDYSSSHSHLDINWNSKNESSSEDSLSIPKSSSETISEDVYSSELKSARKYKKTRILNITSPKRNVVDNEQFRSLT